MLMQTSSKAKGERDLKKYRALHCDVVYNVRVSIKIKINLEEYTYLASAVGCSRTWTLLNR